MVNFVGDKGQKTPSNEGKKENKGKDVIAKNLAPKKRRAEQIVRIMSVDLDSTLSIKNALRNVKGIGFRASSAILTNTGIDSSTKLSELSAEQIKTIEDAAKNAEFPNWMKNTTKRHIVMSDIDLKRRNDINLLQKTRAYRGVRHERGLPVRGQRTRGCFRKNKTVGVVKKKALDKKKGK